MAGVNLAQLGSLNRRAIRAIAPLLARVDELLGDFPALHPH